MRCTDLDPVLHFQGERAILATMHGKERVIAPLARRFLGLALEPVAGLDTDAFGTFTRTVARIGSPLDAARAKIAAGLALQPDARIALASEGSFGRHPTIPFCVLARELVMLVDRGTGLEIVGHYATPDTNFGHTVVTSVAAGLDFARWAGFPEHSVIVTGRRDNYPAPEIAMFRDSASWADLAAAFDAVLAAHGAACAEADMRAHRNPRRMRAIGRATIDLIRRARERCPACGAPGFGVTERVAGLPCGSCGAPTLISRAEVMACQRCGHRTERALAAASADPANCPECNL